MSHLSKIKTKITDLATLKRTLNDLNFIWHELLDNEECSLNTLDLHVNKDQKAKLTWDGNSYELIADSSTWAQKQLLNALTEKIYQRYAYNTILHESEKQGFNNTNTNILQDGSLRIILERWKR